jgi:Family of unknown function (DUF6232)
MQTLQRDVLVTNKIIECDADFWAIQNVTNVNSRQINLKRTDPRPPYSSRLITTCILAEGFALIMLCGLPENRWFWLLPIAVFPFVLFRHISNVKDRRFKYDRMNNLMLYELTIETNSGAKSLFYSDDNDTIKKIKDAIKRAISDTNAAINQTFHINTVNDPIINDHCVIDTQTVNN